MSHTDTAAGQPSNATGDTPSAATPSAATLTLPDDVATLQRMVLELLASLQQRDHDNSALRHRLALLLRRLYGPRNERVDPNQKLFDFPEQPENPPPPLKPDPVELALGLETKTWCISDAMLCIELEKKSGLNPT